MERIIKKFSAGVFFVLLLVCTVIFFGRGLRPFGYSFLFASCMFPFWYFAEDRPGIAALAQALSAVILIGVTWTYSNEANQLTKATQKLEIDSRRPWLNLNISETHIDRDKALVEVILDLRAAQNRDPARFVKCYAWVYPQGAGSFGGGISLQSSVILPGESIRSEYYPCIRDPKYYDQVFKYNEKAELKVSCRYGMISESEYRTEKVFILDDNRKYSEDPNRTTFE